jgi:hypothetical protein
VKAYVSIDDRSATVRSIYLNVPPTAEALITEAWGEGLQAKETSGKDVRTWLDPETGWRATLRNAFGVNRDLFFENYLPAAQLLGDQPDKLDGVPTPVLGKTVDEVKKAYKDDLVIMIPNKELVLMLLPTEWDHVGTRIQLGASGGKVKELSFSIPWKPHFEARDTLLDLFKHKWGDPKEIEDSNGKSLLLFHDDDPRVEIREDTDRGAWAIVMK